MIKKGPSKSRRRSLWIYIAWVAMVSLFFAALLLSILLAFPLPTEPAPEQTPIVLAGTAIPEITTGLTATAEHLMLPEPDAARPSWNLHVISSEGDGPDGVRMADLNSDGRFDLMTSFEDTGEVMAFFHPGPEKLRDSWPSVNLGVVPRGEDAMGMDVDGDGAMDVVSSHEGDTMGIFVHWGPSDPSLYLAADACGAPAVVPESRGRSWMFALPMDINQDGHVDIVAGSKDDYFNDRNSVGDLGWFEAPEANKRNLENWIYHSIDHVGGPCPLSPTT